MNRGAIIIEDEEKSLQELKEALTAIDPSIELKIFKDLAEFTVWLQSIIEKVKQYRAMGVNALGEPILPVKAATSEVAPTAAVAPVAAAPKADGDVIVAATAPKKEEPAKSGTGSLPPVVTFETALFICKSELLKEKGFGLLRSTREYFLKNSFCPLELPTSFVLTSHETEAFNYKIFAGEVISNVIFKPFDKLILKEHLRIAFARGKAGTDSEVYKQKTESNVELLKDIDVSTLTETSFMTLSDRELKIGSQTKFYGKAFQVEKNASVHARVTRCFKSETKKGFYWIDNEIVGIQNQQISQLRKLIKTQKNIFSSVYSIHEKNERNYNFLVLTPIGGFSPKAGVEPFFKNANWIEMNDFGAFAMELDPSAKSLQQDKPKDKPLPAAVVKFLLDQTKKKFLGFEGQIPETANVFGIPLKTAKETDVFLVSRVFVDDKQRLTTFLKDTKPKGSAPDVFRFRMADERLVFLKFVSFEERLTKNAPSVWPIEMIECTEQERKDFIAKQGVIPSRVDALFVDAKFFGENYSERWTLFGGFLNERNKKAGGAPVKIFMISDRPFNMDEVLEKQAPIHDIFCKPLDAPYFAKRLKDIFGQLVPKGEDIEVAAIPCNETFKAAQPVKGQEVSEVGMSLLYDRAIPVGAFRKVALTLPHLIGAPEFLASCVGSEEIEIDKVKKFICSFVFFGVRDDSLKSIRTWIKEYYVTTKEGEE